MSDGCTCSPDSGWWVNHIECCYRHDEAYYYGGSKADRRKADRALRECLIQKGMPRVFARITYWAGRLFGGPGLRRPFSWSFGGKYYKYSECPAEPER